MNRRYNYSFTKSISPCHKLPLAGVGAREKPFPIPVRIVGIEAFAVLFARVEITAEHNALRKGLLVIIRLFKFIHSSELFPALLVGGIGNTAKLTALPAFNLALDYFYRLIHILARVVHGGAVIDLDRL